jgi:hypothetical protein
MRRFLIAVVSSVVFVACGLATEPESGKSPASAQRSDALCACATQPAPLIPALPLDFATAYPPGTPLYTARVDSAYTVILKNPNRPYDFTAYGFDPKNNTTVFYVHGDAADLARLNSQHHLDVESINVIKGKSGSASVNDSIQGQIIKPPPNPPPTGQDLAAQAYKAFQINQ